MGIVINTLLAHYCEECHERMLRVDAVISRYGDNQLDAEAYDYLHQEFDSLVGASRAINIESLEQFNHAMTSLTRYLRNKLPLPVTDRERELLKRAVMLITQCAAMPDNCVIYETDKLEDVSCEISKILEQDKRPDCAT